MKKKILILLAIVIVAAIGVYKYAYQEHRNIETEKAAFVTTASEMIDAFRKDAEAASAKYTNKTIEVSGAVTAQEENSITIDNSIYAQFTDTAVKAEGAITFKGRCLGYDELLEEIKFDQCTLIK